MKKALNLIANSLAIALFVFFMLPLLVFGNVIIMSYDVLGGAYDYLRGYR